MRAQTSVQIRVESRSRLLLSPREMWGREMLVPLLRVISGVSAWAVVFFRSKRCAIRNSEARNQKAHCLSQSMLSVHRGLLGQVSDPTEGPRGPRGRRPRRAASSSRTRTAPRPGCRAPGRRPPGPALRPSVHGSRMHHEHSSTSRESAMSTAANTLNVE